MESLLAGRAKQESFDRGSRDGLLPRPRDLGNDDVSRDSFNADRYSQLSRSPRQGGFAMNDRGPVYADSESDSRNPLFPITSSARGTSVESQPKGILKKSILKNASDSPKVSMPTPEQSRYKSDLPGEQ